MLLAEIKDDIIAHTKAQLLASINAMRFDSEHKKRDWLIKLRRTVCTRLDIYDKRMAEIAECGDVEINPYFGPGGGSIYTFWYMVPGTDVYIRPTAKHLIEPITRIMSKIDKLNITLHAINNITSEW